MFDLRVIQSNCFLCIAASYMPRLRCPPERRNPPERENHEPNKEEPSMYRTSRLFHTIKPQRPRCFLLSRWFTRILHVEFCGSADGRCVWGDECADGDGHARNTASV